MAPSTAALMPPIVSDSSTVSSMLWPAPLTLSRNCCAASMVSHGAGRGRGADEPRVGLANTALGANTDTRGSRKMIR